MTQKRRTFLRRFWSGEKGNSTIEFALLVPLVFVFFMTSIEIGMYAMYQMWLDRGLDITVRSVRLNTGANYSHSDLKSMICEHSGNLEDCDQTIRLEMKPVDPRSFAGFTGGADCVDISQPVTPLRTFVHGGNHELMLLRACYKFKPVFPTAGLGKSYTKDGSGRFFLTSESVFVQEPGT